MRRGGRGYGLGVEFDVYWLDPDELERLAVGAGFTVTSRGSRPADEEEVQPQGFLVARRG